MKFHLLAPVIFLSGVASVIPATADTVLFSSGNVTNLMAAASRPATGGKTEIEAADDFVLSNNSNVSSASFTGVVTGTNPTVGNVSVEIYRVFPLDSTAPPSGNVPTRVNSPSDVAFLQPSPSSFSITNLGAFTASNSVLNGINKIPNQTTGGEGAVTGTEFTFNLSFGTPFLLDAGHYFFVPQVEVTGGEFYWLSSVGPIVAPGTPFAPDLQAWIRNDNLDPDWLRIGTDIVGGATPPTFNAAFSLNGAATPEPASIALFGTGILALAGLLRKKR